MTRPSLARGLAAAGLSLLVMFALLLLAAWWPHLDAQRLLVLRAVSAAFLVWLARTPLAALLGVPASELGVALSGRSWVRFAHGAMVGAAALLLAFCVAWGAGGFDVVPGAAWSGAAPFAADLALYLVAALFEELAFRATLLGPLRLVLPPPLAVGVTGAVFGLMHALNPGASSLSVLVTMLAGIALGLAFLERRGEPGVPSLGFCTGLHFAWNATQSELLGVPVSGYPAKARLLEVEPKDLLWSGGSYGLEASLAAAIVLALLCLWLTRRAVLSSPLPSAERGGRVTES